MNTFFKWNLTILLLPLRIVVLVIDLIVFLDFLLLIFPAFALVPVKVYFFDTPSYNKTAFRTTLAVLATIIAAPIFAAAVIIIIPILIVSFFLQVIYSELGGKYLHPPKIETSEASSDSGSNDAGALSLSYLLRPSPSRPTPSFAEMAPRLRELYASVGGLIAEMDGTLGTGSGQTANVGGDGPEQQQQQQQQEQVQALDEKNQQHGQETNDPVQTQEAESLQQLSVPNVRGEISDKQDSSKPPASTTALSVGGTTLSETGATAGTITPSNTGVPDTTI
ncbi:hypothetical protein QBC35DRAFT_452112 [Podospora australis]|uniref:Uncharacterized protein n=1 Tax=Podospora australis TaxID=1536484 RepID=A0AAN6WT30_9PEZI|nr:hypothetical protein QBC35DRAFT_452112 [Podospora australis]